VNDTENGTVSPWPKDVMVLPHKVAQWERSTNCITAHAAHRDNDAELCPKDVEALPQNLQGVTMDGQGKGKGMVNGPEAAKHGTPPLSWCKTNTENKHALRLLCPHPLLGTPLEPCSGHCNQHPLLAAMGELSAPFLLRPIRLS